VFIYAAVLLSGGGRHAWARDNGGAESLGDTAFDREGTFPHVSLAAESMQNSKTRGSPGDTAFERAGTFPQVFLATESLQSSKTCNTALNCRMI
jgi:hypothetical protein